MNIYNIFIHHYIYFPCHLIHNQNLLLVLTNIIYSKIIINKTNKFANNNIKQIIKETKQRKMHLTLMQHLIPHQLVKHPLIIQEMKIQIHPDHQIPEFFHHHNLIHHPKIQIHHIHLMTVMTVITYPHQIIHITIILLILNHIIPILHHHTINLIITITIIILEIQDTIIITITEIQITDINTMDQMMKKNKITQTTNKHIMEITKTIHINNIIITIVHIMVTVKDIMDTLINNHTMDTQIDNSKDTQTMAHINKLIKIMAETKTHMKETTIITDKETIITIKITETITIIKITTTKTTQIETMIKTTMKTITTTTIIIMEITIINTIIIIMECK